MPESRIFTFMMRIIFSLFVFASCYDGVSFASTQNDEDVVSESEASQKKLERKIFIENIEKAKGDHQQIVAYYNYGLFLDGEGEFNKSVDNLNKALQIAKKASNDSVISKVTNYLGGMYWGAGDCPTSTHYFEQALESAMRLNDQDLIALVKMNLSGNYNSSGNSNKAIEFALEALKIKETNNRLEGICFDYVTVGEIFQGIGNVEKWKDYILKAYKLKDKTGCATVSDVVMIYNNLGSIAEYEKDYSKALACYDTMRVVSKADDYFEGMGISLLNSALIYQELKKPAKALELAEESEKYLGDVPYFVMAINSVKAELMQEMRRFNKARDLAMNNLNNENIQYYPGLKKGCFELLYTINFELANYQEAFNWNDSLRAYEARLREEENLKAIEELETKYQTEKKEQHIELLKAENEIKHQELIVAIVSTVSLLLLIVVGLLLYFKKKKENQLHQLSLRQQLLRSQMNPHFLFNALGSIQNFMYKNETKKAAGFLGNFASLTRAILEHSAEEFIPLSEEIETLRNYLKLEQMRVQNRFSFQISFDEELDTEFINIPPMLIQPFVENSIKHGLKNLDYPGELNISFTACSYGLEIEITDNGHGINSSEKIEMKNKGHRSMSMQIFKERKEILANKFKKEISFRITDRRENDNKERGTTVKIVIPV